MANFILLSFTKAIHSLNSLLTTFGNITEDMVAIAEARVKFSSRAKCYSEQRKCSGISLQVSMLEAWVNKESAFGKHICGEYKCIRETLRKHFHSKMNRIAFVLLALMYCSLTVHSRQKATAEFLLKTMDFSK